MKKFAILSILGAMLFACTSVVHAAPKEKVFVFEKFEKQVSVALPEFSVVNHFVYAFDREVRTLPAGNYSEPNIGKPCSTQQVTKGQTYQLTGTLPARIKMLQIQRYPIPVNDGKYDNRLYSYGQYWRNISTAESRV